MNLVSQYKTSESQLLSALRQALSVLVLPCTFALFPQSTFALIELTGANKLTAGQNHTCTLTTAGIVKCWGTNSSGQLGDNTVIARALPTEVPGLANITAVATGDAHTCALTNTGGVKCWGNNANGQLGDNSTIDRLSPVNVSGLATGVTALIAGVSHTCAITAAGGVKCWGFNGGGQLGDGTTTDRLVPTDVTSLTSGATLLAAGAAHTCAFVSSGVKCWGANDNGQLGDNSQTSRLAPTNVSGLTSGVNALTAGTSHTCAIASGGGVKCWGNNADGQVGDGTTTTRLVPTDASGLTTGVAGIVAGYDHSCARTNAGGIKCWGNNGNGQVGDNTGTMRTTPVDVPGLASGAGSIAAGMFHTCTVIGASNGVKCWGNNTLGALGDNTLTTRPAPVDVSTLTTGVASIATGSTHTCARTTGNGLKCWGYNGLGALGDNSTTDRAVPADIAALTGAAAAISPGGDHTCVLTSANGVKCWGANASGQLGDGTTTPRLIAADVSGLTAGISVVASGYDHACALTSSSGVKCWGKNSNGQLGDGTQQPRNAPVDVSGLTSGASAITSGFAHSCALVAGGAVKCWGANTNGQLGDNSTLQRTAPVNVAGLTGITAISAGFDHTCALTSTGAVKCWGLNSSSQLGDGTQTQRNLPADVSGLSSGVASIAAGALHTCARTTGGGAKCWGGNFRGQLGDASRIQRATPVDVSGLTSGVGAIATTQTHTCALTTAGGVKCWGWNDYGQVGDGTFAGRRSAMPVLAEGGGGALNLVAVFSRKTHGAAGDFDIPVDKDALIDGAVTVEPRTLGGVHDIVFRFDNPISSVGAVSVVDSAGMPAGSPIELYSGNEVLVLLFNMPDVKRITVSVSGVNGTASAAASLGILAGDINNSRAVNAGDISGVKVRVGQTTNSTNFKFDINASGSITPADVSIVKSRAGIKLP